MPSHSTPRLHLFAGAPNTPGAGIKVEKQGNDRSTVRCGLSTRKNFIYGQACTKFGAAVLHYLACTGLLDNREPK